MSKLFSEGTGQRDEHEWKDLFYHLLRVFRHQVLLPFPSLDKGELPFEGCGPTGFIDEHPLNVIQPIVFKVGPDGGESSVSRGGIMHNNYFRLDSDVSDQFC